MSPTLPRLAGEPLPPLDWLVKARASFDVLLDRCGPDEAERFFKSLEPEAERCMDALPPAKVGLVADLQAHCMEALEESVPPAEEVTPAAGVEVPYTEDGTLAATPPEPANDPGEVGYLLHGWRHPLAEWLRRWEEIMATGHPDTLPGVYFDKSHREVRQQIREAVRFDVSVLRRLTDAEDLGDARCGGRIKAGKREFRRRRRAG